MSPQPPPPAATAPAPVAQPVPPSFSGIWLGTLAVGKGLRVQIRLDLATTPPSCSLDSLDQHAAGIPCSATVTGKTLSTDVPAVRGNLAGAMTDDGNTINATWTQGGPLPLVLTRQASAIEPPKVAFDPPMPPVDVTDLKEVMDKDLAAALASGDLAPGTDSGVTIGVVAHGVRRIITYGTAKPDSVFEIGSITKTFTGLILAQMAEQKKVRLDEPLRALLPRDTVAAPASSGSEITLLDLSTHRSGLPRMPDNFKPTDETNPYADYDKKLLYAFVASHGVALPAKPEFGYSNLGVGLLGQALADRAGTTYEALLRREVTGPLGMHDTVITLTPALRARLVPGHDGAHKPVRPWDFDALAGCGAIRSTAGDMLTYLEAQLHPDRLPPAARATPEGRTLPAAVAASHSPHGDGSDGSQVALNWFLHLDQDYWHNGATGGYSAYALFYPAEDFAVIVLSNTSINGNDDFAGTLGDHVAQRLMGKPAFSLGPSQ